MAEYIEREALLTEIAKGTIITDDAYGMGIMAGVDAVSRMVMAQPAADVAPVVSGRWIPAEPESDVIFICSKCETEISTSWDYDQDEMWNYCPNCGAKMEG